MSDEIKTVYFDRNDISFTFIFRFVDGVHTPAERAISVLKGEVTDTDPAVALASALLIAKLRAAQAKQEWLDDLAIIETAVGPVVLPKVDDEA